MPNSSHVIQINHERNLHWKDYSFVSDMSTVKEKFTFDLLYVHKVHETFVFQSTDYSVYYINASDLVMITKLRNGYTFLTTGSSGRGTSFYMEDGNVKAYHHKRSMLVVN